MFRTTLANLARRKLRLLATSLAVLLGVMFTSGTLVLTDSLSATFDSLFSDIYSHTSAVVRSSDKVEGNLQLAGADSTRGTMPEDLVERIGDADGVDAVDGFVQGYTQIIKTNHKALGNPNQGPPTLGSSWASNEQLSPYQLVSGHGPRNADEIVTDASSAADAGYHLGDKVPLLTPTGRVTKVLVGLTRFGDAESAGGSTMVQFTLPEAQRLLAKPGQLDEIWVRAAPGISEDIVVQRIDALALPHTEVLTGTAASQEAKDLATSFLSFFSVFLLVFAAIALLVGAFIIANTFSILVAQRTRELALLRAIGASARQVLLSVVAEAAVVGVLASAVGLGLGFLIASGLQRALMGSGDLGSGTTLTPRTIIASFVIGIGITVLSALLPARRAARVPPVTAMRDSAVEDHSRGRVRTIVGAVFLCIAAAALIAAVTEQTAAFVGIGAVAGLIGAVVIGPALASTIANAAGILVRRWGTPGRLGVENVLRNPRRTASTASALMIGATLVCAISVFAASAVASIDKLVDTGFSGDVVVTSTGNGIPLADIARIEKAPGVDAMAALQFGAATVGGDGMIVTAADPATLADLVDMKVRRGNLRDMATGDIAVSERVAKRKGWTIGTKVRAQLLDGSTPTFTVRAIYRNPLIAQNVLGSPATLEGALATPVAQIAFVKSAPNVSATRLAKSLDKLVSANPTAKVQTNTDFKKSSASQMDTFLNIVYAMLALAVIIAIIGIVNTLGLSILERTRELGLLRAVGMTRSQLRTVVRIEALLIAMSGTVIGLVLGTAIGSSLIKSFGPGQALTGFAIPWVRLLVVLVAGVAVGLFAAVLPARRAVRLDPLEALATE